MMRGTKTMVVVAVAAALTGCATTSTQPQATSMLHKVLHKKGAGSVPTGSQVTVSNQPYIDKTPVQYEASGPADVSLRLSGATIGDVVQSLAAEGGDTVAFAGSANPQTKVTVDMKNVTRRRALQMVATAAGYVAIVQHKDHQVIISKTATDTFKLPPNLFGKGSSSYSVSATPTDGQGGSSGSGMSGGGLGGPGGGMPPTGGMGGSSSGGSGGSQGRGGAEYNVSGSHSALSRKDFVGTLKQLAGHGASVTANWETGLVSVTATGTGLSRVKEFVDQTVEQALSQVQVQVAIIEVQLSNQMQYGINWQRVLNTAAHSVQVNINTAASVTNPSFTGTLTTASVNSVIKALGGETNIKVVTEPSVITQNGQPAVLFTGSQEPYLGNIQQAQAGVSGSTQTSASLSYALNGISLGVVPNLLNGSNMTVQLVPILSTLGKLQTFQVQGGTLKGYEQFKKQMFINVAMKSGQTLILGGNRSSKDSLSNTTVPALGKIPVLGQIFSGKNDSDSSDDTVVLMHVVSLPPPQYNPLVGETL